jgi:uncharacterized protein YggU (UPF0235/DUF167 family)
MARVAAPPVEGAANAALVDLLASALDVRPRDITVQSGATGRQKQVHIAGDIGVLAPRLEALLAG